MQLFSGYGTLECGRTCEDGHGFLSLSGKNKVYLISAPLPVYNTCIDRRDFNDKKTGVPE